MRGRGKVIEKRGLYINVTGKSIVYESHDHRVMSGAGEREPAGRILAGKA
jgi:hypothetical protein